MKYFLKGLKIRILIFVVLTIIAMGTATAVNLSDADKVVDKKATAKVYTGEVHNSTTARDFQTSVVKAKAGYCDTNNYQITAVSAADIGAGDGFTEGFTASGVSGKKDADDAIDIEDATFVNIKCYKFEDFEAGKAYFDDNRPCQGDIQETSNSITHSIQTETNGCTYSEKCYVYGDGLYYSELKSTGSMG